MYNKIWSGHFGILMTPMIVIQPVNHFLALLMRRITCFLGFGYKKNYGEWLKTLAKMHGMINERLITDQPFQFVNSTLCVERFGKAHTNFLKKKNWFLSKGPLLQNWRIPEDYWSFGKFWLQE